jgi:hypothetical protein
MHSSAVGSLLLEANSAIPAPAEFAQPGQGGFVAAAQFLQDLVYDAIQAVRSLGFGNTGAPREPFREFGLPHRLQCIRRTGHIFRSENTKLMETKDFLVLTKFRSAVTHTK